MKIRTKSRTLNLEDLYAMYALERAHNITQSDPTEDDDGKAVVDKVSTAIKTGTAAAIDATGKAYDAAVDAAKMTIRATDAAVKKVSQDAKSAKKMIKGIFDGEVPVSNRLAALFQLANIVNGDPLSAEDEKIAVETLTKLWPGVYKGQIVNDSELIASEVLRPVALILASKHKLKAYTLYVALRVIAFYECSLSVKNLSSSNGCKGVFQYTPSVLSSYEPSIGKFVPGDTKMEIAYATNYFGEWLMFMANRFTFSKADSAPKVRVFKDDTMNQKLLSCLENFPFTGGANFDIPCLLIILHRSGIKPDGPGYKSDVIHDLLTKRIPSFVLGYVYLNAERVKFNLG